jgi:hypothetical protein
MYSSKSLNILKMPHGSAKSNNMPSMKIPGVLDAPVCSE